MNQLTAVFSGTLCVLVSMSLTPSIATAQSANKCASAVLGSDQASVNYIRRNVTIDADLLDTNPKKALEKFEQDQLASDRQMSFGFATSKSFADFSYRFDLYHQPKSKTYAESLDNVNVNRLLFAHQGDFKMDLITSTTHKKSMQEQEAARVRGEAYWWVKTRADLDLMLTHFESTVSKEISEGYHGPLRLLDFADHMFFNNYWPSVTTVELNQRHYQRETGANWPTSRARHFFSEAHRISLELAIKAAQNLPKDLDFRALENLALDAIDSKAIPYILAKNYYPLGYEYNWLGQKKTEYRVQLKPPTWVKDTRIAQVRLQIAHQIFALSQARLKEQLPTLTKEQKAILIEAYSQRVSEGSDVRSKDPTGYGNIHFQKMLDILKESGS